MWRVEEDRFGFFDIDFRHYDTGMTAAEQYAEVRQMANNLCQRDSKFGIYLNGECWFDSRK